MLVITALVAGAASRARGLVTRQVRTERQRAQLVRYFSANMVDELASDDRSFAEVREETVAVLFVDIVGFTGLSERLNPEELIALLREFHDRMQAAVFDNHGTLDKYLGDGLMATFGTPHRGPRDAVNALSAARAMASSMDAWNAPRSRSGLSPIEVGVGVHWGPVVLGDIGGPQRMEFATLGDTVNIASRIEHLTREMDALVAVTGELVQQVRLEAAGEEADTLLTGFSSVGLRSIRGRRTPLEVLVLPNGSKSVAA